MDLSPKERRQIHTWAERTQGRHKKKPLSKEEARVLKGLGRKGSALTREARLWTLYWAETSRGTEEEGRLLSRLRGI